MPAAVSLIDKSDVDDEGQVHVEQHVGPAKVLTILAQFLKFVMVRIDGKERNLIVTIIEQDAAEFHCLCERAKLAIRADSSTPRDLGVVHDDQPQ